MIEAPFEAFLDEGATWATAREDQQAQARLRAVRHIRAAHEALRGRAFEDVAREFSRGVSADSGGSWGAIGQPLEPPFEEATKLIFQYQSGQYSEPVETPVGWLIVRCGAITPAVTPTFANVQERIRAELTERRFNELLLEYITDLSKRATMSSVDSFVQATVKRAIDGDGRLTQ
jgi:peptidyl-prolyl cis-trans isomerase C